MDPITRHLAHLPTAAVRAVGLLAVLSSALAVLAAVDARWIESVIGLSPDAGSGEAEWGLALMLALAALTLGAVALSAARARRAVAATA